MEGEEVSRRQVVVAVQIYFYGLVVVIYICISFHIIYIKEKKLKVYSSCNNECMVAHILCASIRHIIISYLLPDKIQEQSLRGYLLALILVIDQIWHAP